MSEMMKSLPAHAGILFTKTLHNKATPALEPVNQPLPSPFVACVTGCSRGIGRSTALALTEAGVTGLVITARTEAALEETATACREAAKSRKNNPGELKVVTVAVDVGSDASAQNVAQVLKTEFAGRLDLLINNAGVVSTHESAFAQATHDIDSSQIDIPLAVNYTGRFAMIKHLMPLLLATPNGAKTVVNVSSVGSHFAGFGADGFNISEHASNRLIEVVGSRYKKEGVLAFAIHPGVVETSAPPGMPKKIVKGTTDDPALCAAVILHLTRERCDWLSGRYISATWDMDELKAMREEIVEKDKLKFRMVV